MTARDDAAAGGPAEGGAEGGAEGWLDADEPPPFEIVNPQGRSAFVLTCDHASNRMPRRLGTLGLAAPDLLRHVAWDPGAALVARALSARLDAALAMTAYSRLVIDPNRPPAAPDSIPPVSEATIIPGNAELGEDERAARQAVFFRPYHDAVAALLDRRQAADRPTALVAVHSFTPVYAGRPVRPWHVGFGHLSRKALAERLVERFRGWPELVVGDNEPYAVTHATDYGIPVHGERRGLPAVLVEIRQDLLADEAASLAWADRLAAALRPLEDDAALFAAPAPEDPI